MKGEVEVPVLNNAHVTYFYYLTDSTSFIKAGKDPVVLSHYSYPALSSTVSSCLFYDCHLVCEEARWRSSVMFLWRKTCHVQWKKTTLIKHIISALYEVTLCQMHLPVSRFPSGPHCSQPEQCQYYVCSWAKRKESWGLWFQQQKVANDQIDVPCWCSLLKVITEANSHGSLKILKARLRIHCWWLLIMRALHSGCSDTVWLSNGYTWTLTPHSLSGDEAVTPN